MGCWSACAASERCHSRSVGTFRPRVAGADRYARRLVLVGRGASRGGAWIGERPPLCRRGKRGDRELLDTAGVVVADRIIEEAEHDGDGAVVPLDDVVSGAGEEQDLAVGQAGGGGFGPSGRGDAVEGAAKQQHR